jgi:hypothetical protein
MQLLGFFIHWYTRLYQHIPALALYSTVYSLPVLPEIPGMIWDPFAESGVLRFWERADDAAKQHIIE